MANYMFVLNGLVLLGLFEIGENYFQKPSLKVLRVPDEFLNLRN